MANPIVQFYRFDSPEIQKNKDLLVKTINKGYAIFKDKFGLITSPRIQNSLEKDFQLTDVASSYMVLMFAPELTMDNTQVFINTDDNGTITREKLTQLYKDRLDLSDYSMEFDDLLLQKFNQLKNKNGKLYSTYKNGNDVNNNQLVNTVSPQIPEVSEFHKRFLGMTCLKPHEADNTYEVTGFISFYPGAGKSLMEINDYLCSDIVKTSKVWVIAIHEHKLKLLYEKFGYKWHELESVSISGGLSTEKLESALVATSDFHLDIMSKNYPLR
ncbi:hypothetical protein DAMA08_035510 [Martiniozyma asiatica (nom. inval.)]|nr:hypothetical protein DAMA08_035510 [Martiniozyma asiatica]